MPRKGYNTISVTDEIYYSIQKKAQENNSSIPQYIKLLITKEEKASSPTSLNKNDGQSGNATDTQV